MCSDKKNLDDIESRARARKDKPMLRLIDEIRARDRKIKNPLSDGVTPRVGDDILIRTSYYIDHGEDDICGGYAEISKVRKEGTYTWVEVREIQGTAYNWEGLNSDQEELLKQFPRKTQQTKRAHRCPDLG